MLWQFVTIYNVEYIIKVNMAHLSKGFLLIIGHMTGLQETMGFRKCYAYTTVPGISIVEIKRYRENIKA